MSKATSEVVYSFLKCLYCLKNFFNHFLTLLIAEAWALQNAMYVIMNHSLADKSAGYEILIVAARFIGLVFLSFSQ
jgi:hypothetical protein